MGHWRSLGKLYYERAKLSILLLHLRARGPVTPIRFQGYALGVSEEWEGQMNELKRSYLYILWSGQRPTTTYRLGLHRFARSANFQSPAEMDAAGEPAARAL
jgi:hypothetical protein